MVENIFQYSEGIDLTLKDKGKCTVLHKAAEKDDSWLPIVKIMVDGRADINARGPNGRTPLHAALDSTADNIAICLFLLRCSHIDLSCVDNDGCSLLYLACGTGESSTAEPYFLTQRHLHSSRETTAYYYITGRCSVSG